jgi:hypothetical protein
MGGGSGVNWSAHRGSFHAADPFLYQIDAQNWSSVVLNSLVKVSKNEVIIFEGLKISLKSLVGPVGLG